MLWGPPLGRGRLRAVFSLRPIRGRNPTRALLGQQAVNLQPSHLWTDGALSDWATPIAGVNERPHHYSEAEYYATPVTDEVRTIPLTAKDLEPAGYRAQLVAMRLAAHVRMDMTPRHRVDRGVPPACADHPDIAVHPPADVREAKNIKRLGLWLPSLGPVVSGIRRHSMA
jgi:hypothetical protein